MSTNGSRALADSLVYPYLNHAASMYEEGYASREDIDNGMRFGCGLPKGPLAVIDELGVDIVRDALAAMHAETGEEMHRPRPVLDELVALEDRGHQFRRRRVTRPAIAHRGLKLREVVRKTRLPCRSPFHARTRAKSVAMASSRTNSCSSVTLDPSARREATAKLRVSLAGEATTISPAWS